MIPNRSYSLLSLILLLLCFSQSFSQDLEPPKLTLPITAGAEQDAYKLVSRLTEGRESDKDKFDAIFTWVSQNIHYDYATYLAPRGATMPQLKRILQSKSGICIDYAFLMDTLCRVAGIQNVSVFGYVKDELFDVEDSLYIDNHAWNAVKLDNFWYVYDVTWSAGRYHLEFRKVGKWILKTQNKLFKTKKRSIRFRRRKTECDPNAGKFTVTYEYLPWWRYRLIRMLSRIPVRIRWVMDKNTKTDFYLVNPEVMAVTHMPDDPKWSLTANYPGIRAFEVDPKYYHLEDTLYQRQVRTGRHCGECDDWFTLDDLAKEKQMKKNTREFNPRNHFAPFNADYNIANIFYKRSLPLDDSTTKIQHIDSAIAYYNLARDDLRKASRDVNMDYKLQRAKNTKKMKLLIDENRSYQSFVHALLATTNKSTGSMKKFIARTRVTELRLENTRDKLKDLYVKTNPYNNKDNV
ncbi:MAG TPA: transglutaminase domain-containing protein, partial [Bacteroidia bacterium]